MSLTKLIDTSLLSRFKDKMLLLIPTKTSDLTNDSGFLTSAPVSSVNGNTGAVNLDADDVGAVAVSQGVAHAGEFLVVDSNGDVTTVTMTAWQGGNY